MEKIDASRRPAEKSLAVVKTEFGTPVRVPRVPSGFVFARIHLDYSPLGRLARIVYKPPPVYIRLMSSGMTLKYRLVPSTAKNGVFLSRYVLGTKDLQEVWNGRLVQELNDFVIATDRPRHFNKQIESEFFEVPYDVTRRDNWKVECSATDTVSNDASFSIDVVQGEDLVKLRQPIEIDRSDSLVISGWAVDPMNRDLAGDVFVKIDAKLVAPADQERLRQDVAVFLGDDAYAYSGWEANLDLEELSPGRHTITLRIISKDGSICYEPEGGVLVKVSD